MGDRAPAETAAGTFDTYRIECVYDGVSRNNYYAPALGRVVLQTADTILDSTKLELIGFERGPAEPAQVAAKEGGATNLAPASYTPKAGGDFGVQVAAYRSPERAKEAWKRLRGRSGGLLEGLDPTFEQGNVNGTTLFRVIVGNYPSKKEARAYCGALKRAGVDCWPRERAAVSADPRVAAAETGAGPRALRR